MKLSGAVFGLMGLLAAGSAQAGLQPGNAIYSSFVTNLPDQGSNPNFPLTTGASGIVGSPLAQEFHVSSPTTLTSLWLRLSDASPTLGGSILVYLVPNTPGSPPLPSHTGLQLTGTTLLGTIFDSSLPVPGVGGCVFGGASATINACNTQLTSNTPVTTGDYWIALVNGSDFNNGGSDVPTSNALWWRSGDNNGLNAAGLYNSHVNTAPNLTAQNMNAFELQVNAVGTPEPASMVLLGAGLVGLGLARRRARKSAE